jgi:hypothetical protein
MANGLYDDNPSQADVVLPYGSAGAAGYFAMQQELLRRYELQRQAQADARQKEVDALNQKVKLQELQNATDTAAALREERKAKTDEMGLKGATLGLSTGDTLTPEQKQAIIRFGGAGLVKSTPAMTGSVPDQFAQAPEDTADAAASGITQTPASDVYKGTADQQVLDQHRAYAKKIVDALEAKKANGDELTPLEQEQLYEGNAILMTGKSSTAPAGVVVPKTSQGEKDSTRYLNAKKDQLQNKPVSPDDAAFIKAYEAQHPTEAQKQTDRIVVVDRTNTNAEGRAVNARLDQRKSKFVEDLNEEDKKARDAVERAQRASSVMSNPSFLSDVLAAPEVLQIVAGGQGSGLRMTTAELQAVQNAQTKMESLLGQARKATGLGEQTQIGDALRNEMRRVISIVQDASQRRALLRQEALRKVQDAQDSGEVDDVRADYWAKRDETPKSDLPKGVVVRKRQ